MKIKGTARSAENVRTENVRIPRARSCENLALHVRHVGLNAPVCRMRVRKATWVQTADRKRTKAVAPSLAATVGPRIPVV